MNNYTFGRKKAGTSFSNPSLVSPNTPTLANPIRGFGLPTNNIQTATSESNNLEETQVADGESLKTIEQPSFGHDISRIALRRPQAKLTVGEPGDKYEQEADWMANQVMPMVVPDKLNAASVKPVQNSLQRKCAACEEEEEKLETKPSIQLATDKGLQVGDNIESPSGLIIQCKKENEETLAAIQGHAMFNLLPRLQALPEDVRNDEQAGGFVGGPRLVTAMRVVKEKGKPWLDFVAAHNGELAALPSDQIADVMSFLGAPKEARYFKSDLFDGRFDGAVDPDAGVVTLFFRVRFEVESAKFGTASPGTPEWEKETQAGLQQFKADFKQVVEETWSGKGSVRPTCPVGSIKALQTKVVVSVVDSGEHKLIHIFSDVGEGRSNMGQEGNLKVNDNKPKTETKQVVDSTGRHPEQVTNTQITSAHEFGHAIGLSHPRCPGGDDNCYGVTAEERRDVMGGGDKLQVIKRAGKIVHDDFQPFERIAEQWGKDIFPGALAHCNKWSAG
ncbi:hypothetical protein H6G93_23330 [Nostoc sp. FACHB-973]|nr:hypothetical protein [Nostoc sp. FACHB-973]